MKNLFEGLALIIGSVAIGVLMVLFFQPTAIWTVVWLSLFLLLGIGMAAAEPSGQSAPGGSFNPTPYGQGHKGVMPIETAIANLLVLRGNPHASFRVAILRQSGNEDRYLVTDDRAEVENIVRSTFRRKRVDEVRIWKNTPKMADLRINHYHAKGTREGRVIAGVRVTRL